MAAKWVCIDDFPDEFEPRKVTLPNELEQTEVPSIYYFKTINPFFSRTS